jgi:hypothetical protein
MVVLLIAAFIIGWLVGAKQEQKRIKKPQIDYQNEDIRISPCVGHELESQKEIEKGDINFMYNWIREKSGKNDNYTK